jgi:hypothetical protein
MVTEQTQEEKKTAFKYWMDHIQPRQFAGLEDSFDNGYKIADYISRELGDVWTVQNISAAVQALKNNLHGLGVQHSPEYLAAQQKAAVEKAAKEKQDRVAAALEQTINMWLEKHCPTGLKSSSGQPYEGDVHRIIEYLKTNHGPAFQNGQITTEDLNNSISVLAPVLTWFSNDPAARQIRNRPVPVRKLSRQAQIDAGIIPAETQRPNHATDGKLNSLEDLVKFAAKEELRKRGITESPIMAEANTIVVQDRRGRIDRAKTAEVLKVNIFANGKLDETATLNARKKQADFYERNKNQI